MNVTIRTSMSELKVMAQKALEAAGGAPGLERDGAFATVWHETRGLDGLAMLVRDLDALSGLPTRIDERIDAGGLSALVVAPLAIDLAMVMDIELKVENIRSPFAAVAYATRRARDGRWFRLTWDDSEAVAAEGAATITRTDPDVATVLTIASGEGPPPAILAPALTAVELEKRCVHTLNDGLFLAIDARKVLLEAANRVLVPASEGSRSGAGAEVDDNE